MIVDNPGQYEFFTTPFKVTRSSWNIERCKPIVWELGDKKSWGVYWSGEKEDAVLFFATTVTFAGRITWRGAIFANGPSAVRVAADIARRIVVDKDLPLDAMIWCERGMKWGAFGEAE